MRFPDEALIHSTPEIREQIKEMRQWTMTHELLARVVEEVSVLAADRRRKKPLEVPRPEHARPSKRRKSVKAGEPNPEGFKHAIGVLQANAKTVYRR